MNLITVTCPTCRVKDSVPGLALLVELADDDFGDQECCAVVNWVCLPCGDLVGLPVDGAALRTLESAGIPVLELDTGDPRPAHPELWAAGPALTPDDLLAFHEVLSAGAGVVELVASLDQPAAESG
jgi:hypothetical protein